MAEAERIRARLAEDVDAVAESLGISTGRPVTKASVSMLMHMLDAYEPTPVRVHETYNTLRQRSSSPDRLDALTSSMRSRSAPELDRFLNTLTRLVSDPSVASSLLLPSQPPASPKPSRSLPPSSAPSPSIPPAPSNTNSSSARHDRATSSHPPGTGPSDRAQPPSDNTSPACNDRTASSRSPRRRASDHAQPNSQNVSPITSAAHEHTSSSFHSAHAEDSFTSSHAAEPPHSAQKGSRTSNVAAPPPRPENANGVSSIAHESTVYRSIADNSSTSFATLASQRQRHDDEQDDDKKEGERDHKDHSASDPQRSQQGSGSCSQQSAGRKRQKGKQHTSSPGGVRSARSLDFSNSRGGSASSTRPFWAMDREYMTGAALKQVAKPYERIVMEEDQSSIDQLDIEQQEEQVLDDLLYAMQGIEGTHIRALSAKETLAGVQFRPDESMDPSLLHSVSHILPLCDQALAINYFAEQWNDMSKGLTAQAFASSLKDVMSEWNTLGAKLQRLYDNRRMTLQSAWCYFQPLVRPLDVLSNLCSRVSTRERSTRGSCMGGELINLVYDMMLYNSGDSKVHVLLSKLLKEASRPYMHALYKWLNNGDVDDPYEEFMIVAGAAATESEESHENVHQRAHRHEDTSSTWTNLYMIRHPIPAFIGEEMANKALAAGKYLNILLTCGTERPEAVDFDLPTAPDSVDVNASEHTRRIERCYDAASRELVRLLWNEYDFMGHLRSLKHFFLMDEGDFMLHFIDVARPDLRKKASDISMSKLHSLLGLALRTSVRSNDPHADSVDCQMSLSGEMAVDCQLLSYCDEKTEDEYVRQSIGTRCLLDSKSADTLDGFDLFELVYRVQWPVSLVLSGRFMIEVQNLFRFMLQCKLAEQQAYRAWQRLSTSSKNGRRGQTLVLNAFLLCQKLIHLWQNVLYYLSDQVIEPCWMEMERNLRGAACIDDIIHCTYQATSRIMCESNLNWDLYVKLLADLRQQTFGACEVCENVADNIDEHESITKRLKTFADLISEDLNALIFALSERARKDPTTQNLLLRLSYNRFFGDERYS